MSLPHGYTAQLDRKDKQTEQNMFHATDVEPGIAQTLLDIANPESEMEVDNNVEVEIIAGQLSSSQSDLEGLQDGSVINVEDVTEAQRKQIINSIHSQIAALCGQLSDFGAESFLVTFQESDKTCQHIGSVKGDHYCLLHSEMLKDFSDFCQGKESEVDGVEKETDQDMAFPEEDNVQEEAKTEDTPSEVKEDDQALVKPVEVTQTRAMTPRVIVLKKSVDGKITSDHQYITGQTPAVTAQEPKPKPEKENQKGPNILFLCDVCKSVFNNVIALREHKKEMHNETEYPCNKCSRVFTLQKGLEKHLADAHFDDNRFICDSCVKDFNSAEELAVHIDNFHDSDLPMRCDVCEQTFPDLPNLMSHRKAHFDYACFCTKCWQGFFDYLELETHQQQNCHYKEALYKCYICGKKFTKLSLISKHIDTHPVHSPHVCRMCGRGFDSEKDLKNHRIAAHIIRPYKCEMCDKTFKKKDTLIDHRRIHLRVKLPGTIDSLSLPTGVDSVRNTKDGEAEPEFECNICGIRLSSQRILDQHMHQHETSTEQFSCEQCDKVFFSQDLLSQHCRKDHKMFLNEKENPILSTLRVCEWEGCNKTFFNRGKLRQHIKYHEQRADKIARGIPLTPRKSQVTCEVCGKVLKYKSYLKAHMMSHSDEMPYQCEQCGQAYPTSKRLAEHIRVHNGEKPFKCKLCDKAFTSNALLNQHMVVHWSHKKFVCDVCGKGFMSRKHFHDHLRIHNGEQQYRCEACGKEFIYYRSLVRHSQVHMDPKLRPKPYKCEFCKKEYTEVTGYKHHMRSVHTGENPYQCEICGEGFHRNDKLKRHLRTRHNWNDLKQGVIVTTRRQANGGPVIVKTESDQREELYQNNDQLLQIVSSETLDDSQNELHVDVVQDGSVPQQVFLIGLGNQEGGEPTYLQETQVIEGPDGVRYIIAGSGQLEVVESDGFQHLSEGEVIEGNIVQPEEDEENVMIMNDGAVLTSDQETLSTLANMASVAEISQQ